jgi:hypothetical protein
MSPNASMEELAREISSLDRHSCIDQLQHFDRIPLDFNRSFFDGMSTEKLRHVLMAAYITVKKRRA